MYFFTLKVAKALLLLNEIYYFLLTTMETTEARETIYRENIENFHLYFNYEAFINNKERMS